MNVTMCSRSISLTLILVHIHPISMFGTEEQRKVRFAHFLQF